MTNHLFRLTAAAGAAIALAGAAHAEMSAEELAKLAQNPVGNMISVPFQNNTNLNTGPLKGSQNILNIQPVIPVELNADWNVITRTILPVVSQPAMFPGGERTNGIGDAVFTAFLSPAVPKGVIWGVGPVVQLPTDTNGLGNKNWGMGASAVILKIEKGNPWVYGALFNNVWSLTSDRAGGGYNNGLLQPFLNYNFPDYYLTTLLPDHVAGDHGELEGRQQPGLDGSAGRRHRQDLPYRQVAGERPGGCVLQRGQARLRSELAGARTGAADVPQVKSIGAGRRVVIRSAWPDSRRLGELLQPRQVVQRMAAGVARRATHLV